MYNSVKNKNKKIFDNKKTDNPFNILKNINFK